jgi:hypothetical protein
MTLGELASSIFETAESIGVPHMAVGAIPAGTYGIPRATKDIDLLVSVDLKNGIHQLIAGLSEIIEFGTQCQFDTLTWGRRYVGVTRKPPLFKVELFEMFDDDFVKSEFSRRQRRFVPLLNREIWIPTAEDVIVQKIRWGRAKDLEDVRDVLAVQGPESLDMPYVTKWCATHGTTERLTAILESLPPL